MPSRPLPSLLAACLLALPLPLGLMTGCSEQQAESVFGNENENLLAKLATSGDDPRTPGQAARDAFNVYDADVRRRAVASLSAAPFGGEAPYVRMYRLLTTDPDPTVRAVTLKALGDHGDVSDAPALIAALKDDSSFVRWEAAKALRKIHHENAPAALVEVLRNETDVDTKMAAADALGQYPQPFVFQTLVGALDDRDFGVVESALQSLRTITGQDFPADGRAWLAWAQSRSPSDLFVDAKPYTWTPYVKPRSWLDKAQFWKPAPTVEPKTPMGVKSAESSSNATSPVGTQANGRS